LGLLNLPRFRIDDDRMHQWPEASAGATANRKIAAMGLAIMKSFQMKNSSLSGSFGNIQPAKMCFVSLAGTR